MRILFFILLSTSWLVAKSESISLSGRVVESSGQNAIEGTEVFISEGANSQQLARTDSEGYFSFTVPLGQIVEFKFVKAGFTTKLLVLNGLNYKPVEFEYSFEGFVVQLEKSEKPENQEVVGGYIFYDFNQGVFVGSKAPKSLEYYGELCSKCNATVENGNPSVELTPAKNLEECEKRLIQQNESDYFEGLIVYSKSYSAESEQMQKELAKKLGARHEYFISEGKYRNIGRGESTIHQIYSNEDGKVYSYEGNSPSDVLVQTASENPDSVISIEYAKTDTVIMGFYCQKLIMTSLMSVTEYFYSPEIKVDPNSFESHDFGNWNLYLLATEGALPLKYTVNNGFYTEQAEAKKVLHCDLRETLFIVQTQ